MASLHERIDGAGSMLLLEEVMDAVGGRINEKEKKQDSDGKRAASHLAQRLFDDFHFRLVVVKNIARGPVLVNPVTKLHTRWDSSLFDGVPAQRQRG
jgi:hypothetical protein